MDTIALADLAPILAAVLGPMMAFAVVVMRFQYLDSTKTRDLIDEVRKENRDLIKENRDLIKQVRTESRGDLREVNRNLATIHENQADVRERLSRIEGRIGIGLPPVDTKESDGEADAA